jgi:hypothetical protein
MGLAFGRDGGLYATEQGSAVTQENRRNVQQQLIGQPASSSC